MSRTDIMVWVLTAGLIYMAARALSSNRDSKEVEVNSAVIALALLWLLRLL